MASSSGPQEYLQQQIVEFPEMKVHYEQLLELYSKKLYHQLSEKLLELLRIPFFQANEGLLNMYEGCVKRFEGHLSELALARFGIAAASQSRPELAAIEFLDTIAERVRADKEAFLLVRLEIAHLRLSNDELDKCFAIVTESRQQVDSYEGMANIVYSAYYRVCLQYYKIKGPPADYCSNALLYLSYTPIDTIPPADRLTLASDLGVAALLGDSIYNFGELLAHPILASLDASEHAWLGEMLRAFNGGDIDRFGELLELHSGLEVLRANQQFLHGKIRIMALIQAVFSRHPHARTLSFDEVAETCRVSLSEVEILVIKSMAIGVVRGKIDEAAKVVEFSWVKPRVLNREQIQQMAGAVDAWTQRVKDTTDFLETSQFGSSLAGENPEPTVA